MGQIRRRLRAVVALTAALGIAGMTSGPAQAASAGAVPQAVATAEAPISYSVPARGSAQVGSAWYWARPGATWVDPEGGNDGSPGTKDRPKKTLRAAIKATQAGGTVILRRGTYHEGNLWVGKPITIQGAPGEAAWLDGSVPVTGWTRSGSTWQAPWSVQWDHRTSFSSKGDDPSWVNPQYPMAGWPDLAFENGKQLRQVAAHPGPGEFAVDYAAKKLVVGSDPAGKEMRASDLNKAITVGSPDVTLRGFGVRRYANSASTLGAVYVARHRTFVQHVVFADIATTALMFYSDGTHGAGKAENISVHRAGLCGVCGSWMDGGAVTRSWIHDANYEHFNNVPTAAAIKVTRTRGVTVADNLVTNSNGSQGIWMDESVVGFTITGNEVRSAGHAGIEAELSSDGIIANNVVWGNKYGIYLFNSEKVQVINNTVRKSWVSDVHMSQDFRRQSNSSHVGHDPRYGPGDPTNTWLLRDITVRNNVFGPEPYGSMYQVYVLDKNTNRSADSMNITLTGNVFMDGNGGRNGHLVGWGQGDNRTVRNFDDWASFVAHRNGRRTTGITGKTGANYGAGTALVLPGWSGESSMVDQGREANDMAWPVTPQLADLMRVPDGTAQAGAFFG